MPSSNACSAMLMIMQNAKLAQAIQTTPSMTRILPPPNATNQIIIHVYNTLCKADSNPSRRKCHNPLYTTVASTPQSHSITSLIPHPLIGAINRPVDAGYIRIAIHRLSIWMRGTTTLTTLWQQRHIRASIWRLSRAFGE